MESPTWLSYHTLLCCEIRVSILDLQPHSDSNPLRKIMTQSLKFGLLLALGGRTNLLSYHNWFIGFFVMVKSMKMAKNGHF